MTTTMMWRAVSIAVLQLSLTTASFADEKPNFTGQWLLDGTAGADKTGAPVKRVIEQDGTKLHIVDVIRGADAKEQTVDIRCTTTGQQCDVKSGGHEGQASFYFLGTMLVELDSSLFGADTVLKRQMKLAADGKSLTIELVSIVPSGKTAEAITLKKVDKPATEVTSAKPARGASIPVVK